MRQPQLSQLLRNWQTFDMPCLPRASARSPHARKQKSLIVASCTQAKHNADELRFSAVNSGSAEGVLPDARRGNDMMRQ